MAAPEARPNPAVARATGVRGAAKTDSTAAAAPHGDASRLSAPAARACSSDQASRALRASSSSFGNVRGSLHVLELRCELLAPWLRLDAARHPAQLVPRLLERYVVLLPVFQHFLQGERRGRGREA